MNKIMARLFAVVLAVMMLGTVCFAATAEIEGDAIATEFETAGYADQTVKTVMAFKAASDAATAPASADDIIALDQAADVASVAIDADAVDSDYVIVLFGGNGEITDKAVIDLRTDVTFETINCATSITFDGKEYTNVAVAEAAFTVSAGKTVTAAGVTWIKDGVTTANTTEVAADTITTINGGGTVNFRVIMTGVPYGNGVTTMQALPYMTQE